MPRIKVRSSEMLRSINPKILLSLGGGLPGTGPTGSGKTPNGKAATGQAEIGRADTGLMDTGTTRTYYVEGHWADDSIQEESDAHKQL
ncbi:hypothetical protein LTR85_001470 [Meristemomyces frigidus]|nr:hypothetical protein LTR85_001470 [Meristemomyces frigidus]